MPSPGLVGVRMEGDTARSRRGRRVRNSRKCTPVFVWLGCLYSQLWIGPSPLRTGPEMGRTWESLPVLLGLVQRCGDPGEAGPLCGKGNGTMIRTIPRIGKAIISFATQDSNYVIY